MSDPVEMRPAYAWTCPECGRDHFCNGIVHEMSDDDLARLKNEYGIERYEQGDFITVPDLVTCDDCGSEFTAEYFR